MVGSLYFDCDVNNARLLMLSDGLTVYCPTCSLNLRKMLLKSHDSIRFVC